MLYCQDQILEKPRLEVRVVKANVWLRLRELSSAFCHQIVALTAKQVYIVKRLLYVFEDFIGELLDLQMKWGEIDKLVYEVEPNEQIHFKILTWAFNKSVLQVVFGLAILTMCATPLGISIQQLSDAMGIPSFLIPFVVVPLALNSRMAISAIFPISQKSSKTASLTFSEVSLSVFVFNFLKL